MSRKRYATLSQFKRAKRWTLDELARHIGDVSPSAVSLYCRRLRRPQPDIALRIAKRCGVPLESLLRLAPAPPPRTL